MGYAGFRWIILLLMAGTWQARGAITMCIQKQDLEGGPKWEMPAHVCLHLILLISLYGVSIHHFVRGRLS